MQTNPSQQSPGPPASGSPTPTRVGCINASVARASVGRTGALRDRGRRVAAVEIASGDHGRHAVTATDRQDRRARRSPRQWHLRDARPLRGTTVVELVAAHEPVGAICKTAAGRCRAPLASSVPVNPPSSFMRQAADTAAAAGARRRFCRAAAEHRRSDQDCRHHKSCRHWLHDGSLQRISDRANAACRRGSPSRHCRTETQTLTGLSRSGRRRRAPTPVSSSSWKHLPVGSSMRR